MKTSRSLAPPGAWCAFAFVIFFLSAHFASAQTSTPEIPSKPQATPTPSLRKKLLVNILNDQRVIWTSPFHLHSRDTKWILTLGLTTASLIATDRRTSGELVEHGDNLARLRISKDISQLGSLYALGGIAGGFYLTGHVSNNVRARETGLLTTEALVDSLLVVEALKKISQRQRPPVDHSSGEFFEGGNSFPSGHAINTWSVATVISREYGEHRPLVRFAVYAVATAVSVSRFTGRKHFLSDVLVGSAMGYGIGRYVYQERHDRLLNSETKIKTNALQSKLIPRITPLYSSRAHAYGAMLKWNF